MKIAHMAWSAKQVCKMIDGEKFNFDNAVQRGYVWDNSRSSLLMDSMIRGYPIPPVYAERENKVYYVLDGKQRFHAVHGFFNGEYSLKDVPEFEDEDGELVELNGKYFNDLPEDLRDALESYIFSVYYIEDATPEEISDLFYRWNNGKALSSFDVMRVKIKDHAKIKEISSHEIFKNALTEKALANNKAEDLAMKSWAILYMKSPSFERKELQPVLENASITDEQVSDVNSAFTRVLDAYRAIANITNKDPVEIKRDKKVMKRILSKTHLVSIIPFALRSVKDDVSVYTFADWIRHFYAGKKRASIDDVYNDNSTRGSSKASAIKAREDVLKKDYEAFVNDKEVTHDSEDEAFQKYCSEKANTVLNTRDDDHPVAFNDMNEEEHKELFKTCVVEKDMNKYEDTIIKAYNRVCDEDSDSTDDSVA
jgi:hypothetical protein